MATDVQRMTALEEAAGSDQDMEQTIKEVWAAVLEVDSSAISSTDDFFSALGGSSLQVLTILERIQELTGGAELPMDMFFGDQTVQGQAQHLVNAGRSFR